MKLKRLFFGEKEPDISDPANRRRYDKSVDAGRRFASFTRFDRLMGKTQRFADRKPYLFLGITFGIVLFFFTLNVVRLVKASESRRDTAASDTLTITTSTLPDNETIPE